MLKIENFENWKFWNLKILKIENFLKLKTLKVENFENLNFWKFKVLKI